MPRPSQRCGPALAAWLALGCAPVWADPAGADDADSPRRWAASVGFVLSHAPEYAGSDRMSTGIVPGGAIRWGRVSLASRSAFAVRGTDAGAQGGLRVELARSDRLRLGLGLRLDSGRRESESPALAGLGPVRGTLRLRLRATWALAPGWRAGAALAADALGRGNGWLGDVQLGRAFTLTPLTTASAGVQLGWGDRRYQQTWFGITPQQAAASGHPAYAPSGGLREVTLSVGSRTRLDAQWDVFSSASATRLLGPAAASPLTRSRQTWSVSAGLMYRL